MPNYILIADNELNIRNTLSEELIPLPDTTIVTAADGLDAYRKSRNQKFNLVIMNFNISKLTGVELISALRSEIHNSQVPIIIITKDLQGTVTKCNESGLNTNIDFIEKPFNNTNDNMSLKSKCEKLMSAKPAAAIKPKLDAEFINPFLNAVVVTLKGMGQVSDVTATKTFLLKPHEAKRADITGNLAIIAPAFVGTISISFPAKTYLTIVSNMLGQQFNEITANIEDAAAEIVNVVYGNAKAVLNEKNYQMEKAIPSLIKGAGHVIRTEGNSPTLITDFSSSAGPFFVSISIDLNSQANRK